MLNNLLAGGGSQPVIITNPVLGNLGNQTGLQFFQSFIPGLITLAFVVAVIIFFFMIVIGAIKWISSGGDKGAVESARGTITNALIGIVILFSVYAVLNLVEIFFNIKILTLDIQSLIIQ